MKTNKHTKAWTQLAAWKQEPDKGYGKFIFSFRARMPSTPYSSTTQTHGYIHTLSLSPSKHPYKACSLSLKQQKRGLQPLHYLHSLSLKKKKKTLKLCI